jgi:hypothetical protein
VIDWATLAAAGLGGLFGVGASIVGVELQQRRQSAQLQREFLTRAVGDVLQCMQRYMREVLSLAYVDGVPYTREVIDGVEHVFPGAERRLEAQETFDNVVSDWNGSLHRLLVTAPPDLVQVSRALDAELDRLLDLAIDHRWSREQFRTERKYAGQLAAQLVASSRRATGAHRVSIENVWTWAEDATT